MCLSLVRDAIAMREAQARGLVVADKVALECDLSFICLDERAGEPVKTSAWRERWRRFRGEGVYLS